MKSLGASEINQFATPTISVDRLVGQYYDNVEVDGDSVRSFYEALPFRDKPPLSECHIYLSGLAVKSRGVGVLGTHFHEEKDVLKLDPLAPPEANVVVFLGSVLGATAQTPAVEILAHEIAHFAAKNEEPSKSELTAEEIANNRIDELKLSIKTSRKVQAISFAATTALISVLVYDGMEQFGNPVSKLEASVAAVVGQTIAKIMSRKRNKRLVAELTAKVIDNHRELPDEKVANNFMSVASGPMLSVITKQERPGLLVRKSDRKNPTIDFLHKTVSLRGQSLSKRNSKVT